MTRTAGSPQTCLWPVGVALALGVTALAAAAEPREDDAAILARYDARIKPSDRQHWSFQPLAQPAVPTVKDTRWVRNPIDRFVLAKLEASDWKPFPSVARAALLRRLYLDVIGLPPTLAEQEAFAKDCSSEAFDRVVRELLARPSYGEHWGRHWLDLVRYAETNGYERDATKPFAWRYRDFVIRAFNADKPFDRFVMEQLAGDELADANAETLIATGYYRLGPWDDEPADPKEDRFDQLDDMVNTTSQVFLGLTLACARCHNHKFEPLTMHDYYRMVAIFDPLQRPQDGRTELDLPAGSRTDVATLARRDRQLAPLAEAARRMRRTTVGVPASATGLGSSPLAALSSLPWLTASAVRMVAGRQELARIEQEIDAVRRASPDLPRGYFMHEPSPVTPATHLLTRGKADRPGPLVAPGMPTVLVSAQPAFPPPGQHTTLRRLTLARWIASPENPLTARVIVNRVWQFHFGEGLVRTPSDFGVGGQPPTHPELLDWLASWFIQEGWSLKKLHHLILTSNTYRMSKRWDPVHGATDPENKLLWRFPYRRLEVEAIRDSMLVVTGQLNQLMYGPSMYPHVPREALSGHSDPDKIWKPFDEREASRRTVYAFTKRSMIVPMLEVLDLCDTARTSARRVVTTVAPQALSLFNGDFVNRQADHFADRLIREAGPAPEEQIAYAYRLALCRRPTDSESAALVQFLKREAENVAKESGAAGRPLGATEARKRALQQMCRVLFNLNEFVYAD
jgi:hypothetical protein